jgi:Flp pilus assembly protein TadD
MSRALNRWAPLAAVAAVVGGLVAHPAPAAPEPGQRAEIALALMELGHGERGKAALDAALAANPQEPQANLNMALLEVRDNKLADAARHLDVALAGAPDNVTVLSSRAMLYRKQGDAVHARALFEKAQRLAPGRATPVYNLAVLAQERNDLKAARALYARYLELDPTSEDRRQVEAIVADLDRRIGEGGK